MLLSLTLGLFSLASPLSSPITPTNKYSFLPAPPVMVSVEQEISNAYTDFSRQNNARNAVEDHLKSDETAETKAGGVCVDYSIYGHYYNRQYAQCQEQGYVRRPATISACELAQLHQDCVDRINMYRSGQLLFSNGQQDSLVTSGIPALKQRTGSNKCSSEAAMGDLIANYQGGGGCAGAHTNAFVCGGGSVGQNSCCASGDQAWGWWDTEKYDTYEKVKGEMFNCLRDMWDEGQSGSGGHWQNMRNPNYAYVSCGFAWSEQGRVFMTQDFTTNPASCSPSCSSCGASDGCSGNQCVCQGSTADTTVSSDCPNASAASPSASTTTVPSSTPSSSTSTKPSPTRTPSQSASSSFKPSASAATSLSAQPSRSSPPSPSATASLSSLPSLSATTSSSSVPSVSAVASLSSVPSLSAVVSPSAVASPSAIASPSAAASVSAAPSASSQPSTSSIPSTSTSGTRSSAPSTSAMPSSSPSASRAVASAAASMSRTRYTSAKVTPSTSPTRSRSPSPTRSRRR